MDTRIPSKWLPARRCNRIIIGLAVFFVRCLPKSACIFLWNLSDVGPLGLGWLVRYSILRRLSRRCGQRVYIGRGCEVRNWELLEIGSDVSIHAHCYLDAKGGIQIGDQVSIAHQTSVLSSDHTWGDPAIPIRDNKVVLKPTRIDNDVWIGCGCRILGGVNVRSRSVVAAGAVVTKDVESGWLAGGVPARPLRRLSEADIAR